MKWWSFYNLDTGEFSDRKYRGSSPEQNTPAGFVRIEGRYDHLSQRVDPDTRMVVNFQPAKPEGDMVWNETSRKWELSAQAMLASAEDHRARDDLRERDIAAMRSVMEILLNPSDPAARARLQQAYDAQVQTRRNLKS